MTEQLSRSRQWLMAPRQRMPLLVFAWSLLVLLAWWAVNFPAQFSFDSTTYVLHVTVGPWVADHSVLYDALIKLSLFLTGNVWLITLAQVFIYAWLLALLASRVRDLGVRARWAALPAVLIVFVPTFGSFVDMLWKDVPFTAANMFLAATVLKIIAQRRAGARAMTWRAATVLGVEMTLITLFRNNGFIVVFLIAVVLVIALAGDRIKVAVVGVAAIVAFELAGAAVYPAFGIQHASSTQQYGVFYGDIANVYASDPGAFSASDLAVLKKAQSLEHWRTAGASCLTSDPVNKHLNWAAANAERYKLAEVWFNLLVHAPEPLIHAHLCRADNAWWIPVTPHFSTLPTKTGGDLFGTRHAAYIKGPMPASLRHRLGPHPISWKLYHAASDVRHEFYKNTTTGKTMQLLFGRAAGWTYLAYLAVIIAAARNKWRMILLAALPILANQLTIMIANPAQLYRYTVVQLFLGMLFIPLVAAKWPLSRKESPDPQPAQTYDSLDA